MLKDLSGVVEFGIRFLRRPWFVQGCLLRQEGAEGDSGVRSTLGEGVYAWKDEEGAVTPVFEERRRGKKGKAAT